MTAQDLLQKLFRGGNDYRLTRFVILRLLGFVYAVAFLVAAQQLVPLVGEHGLTPARNFLVAIESQLGSRAAGAMQVPTLFWLGISDEALSIFSWIGFALSLIDLRPFPKRPPPLLVIWLFRWLGFRIMIGAGLIKLRGDACWRDLTCLYYHYETQPIPNAISRYLHFAPHWFHKFGTAWNHFIELVVPWFSFGPRHVRHIAGLLLVSFQVVLIVSGNLSFLNYVTIIPFLACFDDTFWHRIAPAFLVRRMPDAEPSRLQFAQR